MFRALVPAVLLGSVALASVPLIPEPPRAAPVAAEPTVGEPSISPVIPELDAASTQSVRPGRHVLELVPTGHGQIALVNVSDRPQQVLPALDGSSAGWRVPIVSLEWRDSSGARVVPPRVARCGNMNSLRAQDWVTLQPGEQLKLVDGWLRADPPEGATEMRLTYDTMTLPARPFGDGRGDPATAFASLPEGIWVSAWTKVEPRRPSLWE